MHSDGKRHRFMHYIVENNIFNNNWILFDSQVFIRAVDVIEPTHASTRALDTNAWNAVLRHSSNVRFVIFAPSIDTISSHTSTKRTSR